MFDTNVTGLINMTQAILPIFKARPDNGRGDIINIGSIAGREPYQGGSIYCATKAAVRSFTDALRRELVSSRIRVIEIDPGQVETEFSVVRFYGDAEKAKKVYEGVEPLTPDDIAEVVVFAAGRRENVVIADTLIFPSHQVCVILFSSPDLFSFFLVKNRADAMQRRLRLLCTASRDRRDGSGCGYWNRSGSGLTSVSRPGRAVPCTGSRLESRNYNRHLRARQLSLSHRRITSGEYPSLIRFPSFNINIPVFTNCLAHSSPRPCSSRFHWAGI